MDFSNFGKIKKIFYIVAIISMLLSIKSKVFGATDLNVTLIKDSIAGIGGVTYTATLPSFLNDKYWCIQQIARSNGTYTTYLYYSDDYFSITSNSSTGQFGMNVNCVSMIYSGNDNSVTYDDTFNGLPNNSINGAYYLNTAWLNASTFIYGNFDLYINGNQVNIEHVIPRFTYPSFDNISEIENGNPDGVYISPGDYSRNDNLYFHLLQINTGLSNSDTSIYYYSDKTFVLNKDSNYFSTWVDPNIDGYYYYIPRYKLGLTQNTSYLYVINNSKSQIQNSYGIYSKDEANGIYDVVQSDTAGVITATEEETDRMRNIEQMLVNNQESINDINDSLTNTTASEETETDIESSLNYSNENETISNLRSGFFTRLSAMLANLTNYNLREDTAVSVPLPHSDKNLTFHSIDIYNNVPEPLKTIINLFWVFIFNFYLFKFVNHLYISITTGKILQDFNAKNEVITDQML